MNQNLFGNNEGYKAMLRDPKGGGYTYVNLSYPGAMYNVGSVFREKDMGNLIQLFFTCENYFRYRNIELITDAHFGHFVPVSLLSLWNVFATSSFIPASRIGILYIRNYVRQLT